MKTRQSGHFVVRPLRIRCSLAPGCLSQQRSSAAWHQPGCSGPQPNKCTATSTASSSAVVDAHWDSPLSLKRNGAWCGSTSKENHAPISKWIPPSTTRPVSHFASVLKISPAVVLGLLQVCMYVQSCSWSFRNLRTRKTRRGAVATELRSNAAAHEYKGAINGLSRTKTRETKPILPTSSFNRLIKTTPFESCISSTKATNHSPRRLVIPIKHSW